VLELRQNGGSVEYRWRVEADNFNYPVGVLIGKEPVRLDATADWQVMGKGFSPREVSVDKDRFLVDIDVVE
jgi:hypothetical protein